MTFGRITFNTEITKPACIVPEPALAHAHDRFKAEERTLGPSEESL